MMFTHASHVKAVMDYAKASPLTFLEAAAGKVARKLSGTASNDAESQRGGEVSMRDVSRRMPPLAMNLWLGHKMKPLLNPLASRSRYLKKRTKVAMSLAATAAIGAAVYRLLRGRGK